jgi:hypothetical protein
MTTIELHVQADRELVERLCADFTDDKIIESVEIRSTTPLRRDLLDRGAYRQTELLDVVIALVVNFVSTAAYDGLREHIHRRAEARQVRVVDLVATDQLSPTPDTTAGNEPEDDEKTLE